MNIYLPHLQIDLMTPYLPNFRHSRMTHFLFSYLRNNLKCIVNYFSDLSHIAYFITVKSIPESSYIGYPWRMPSLLDAVSLLITVNTGDCTHSMLQFPSLALPSITECSSPVCWPAVDGCAGYPVTWAQASRFWCPLLVPHRSLHQCDKDTSQKAEEATLENCLE